MNRREFLLLRTEPRGRVLELACERLYMRYLDTQVTGRQNNDSADPAESSQWGGEPPARFAERTPQQLFEELDRELREVEVLRVVDRQWLVGDLRRDFDHLLALFRARGGRVVEVESSTSKVKSK
jgi:hypothetical protein